MDLNGDGHIDLLSGSWPGELFLFRGGPDGTFSPPEMIKDKDGNYINIGGGIKEQSDGSILITGNGEFEETDDGWIVKYHGKTYKSTPEKQIMVTGTASAVHAVDWDDDGDYDLLFGDIGGNVYLIPNEGTAEAYAFGKERQLEAGGDPLRVQGDAGPFTADWDGDGDLDLLVGAGDGSVSLFRNTGKMKAPKLAAAEVLVPPGQISWGADAPMEPTRGIRAKVCAADWNGDGLLDLLVGDYTSQKPKPLELTAEQEAEHERLRKELDVVQKQFSELASKMYGPNRVTDKDEHAKVVKELQAVSGRMNELREKLPPEYESHGWVWLFARKPAK